MHVNASVECGNAVILDYLDRGFVNTVFCRNFYFDIGMLTESFFEAVQVIVDDF